MSRRVGAVALVLAGLAAVLSPAQASSQTPSGLPGVSSGRRPGPPVLYAPPANAPQLANHDKRFRAQPLLVAGTEAYADGEYLYQDFLYDDFGANTTYRDSGGDAGEGDLEYPTDRGRYAANAADLVEFRVASGKHEVAYRLTLNTLLAADSTIASITFDTDGDPDTGSSVLPADPGAAFTGTDEVITTWGTGAQHGTWTSSGWRLRSLKVSTNLSANQITVTVPRTVSNPTGRWRTTVAVGLYDRATRGWLLPQPGEPSQTTPGGARLDGSPGVFNLAFRFDEDRGGPPDALQAAALADRDPTRLSREIDFTALARKRNRSSVPRTGTMVRIFPSRIASEDGKDFDKVPQLRSRLQQYSLYVPTGYRASRPAALTLMLHSLGQRHWQYNGTTGVQQVGEQRTNLVLTPDGRGDNGWYQQEAEYDVFEAWNDVARHYRVHPDRAAVSGYSMGGYGTYRLATLYPDLFGKAFSTVGPPADGVWFPPLPPSGGEETLTNVWLENARNVPFLNVVALLDELVPYAGTRAQNLGAPELGVRGFEQLGYRYRFVTYPAADHFTLAALSYDIPYAVDFLGAANVERNPSHVTFSYVPATDHKPLGLVHDHAYWVSDVRLADASDPSAKGTVDAFSHASGRGDPPAIARRNAGEEPLPYVELGADWGRAPRTRPQNKVTLKLDNVRSVRIDLARTGVDLASTVLLDVRTTDTVMIDVAVPGGGWKVRVPAGGRELRLRP